MIPTRGLKFFTLLLFFGLSYFGYSQTFDAHWWNGRGYLMDFRTTPPTISCNLTSDGAFEATSAWSDPVTGNLLFYADLGTVRDNTGALYTNGTGINTNATRTQMAVVMPVPGTNLQQVYLLHGDGSNESNDGTAYYSIIDVTTRTVISSNNLLQNNTTEALYGTNNGAMCGAWVATIANDTGSCTSNCAGSIMLWRVDSANILSAARANNPDVTASLPVSIPFRGERASIRFSQQNDRIAIAMEGAGIFYASFNSTTGAIGTWTHVPRTTSSLTSTGYSVEFSPDGSRLFYAHDNSSSTAAVGWQSPLYMHVIGSNTSVNIENESLGSWAGVQLGPDDILYVTDNNDGNAYYLTNPNTVTSSGDANFAFLDISTYATCNSSDRQGYNFTQQVVFFTSCLQDTDGDGVYDESDLDDDDDGILDAVEGIGDSDLDGIINSLDLDSDNDGIPDNVEGQSTAGYLAPSNVDSDGNGLDDVYETTPGSGEGLTPPNSDGIDNPDYLDNNSDEDGDTDTVEAGLTLSGSDSDGDGLDNSVDTSSGYSDPGGTIDNPLSGGVVLPDVDGDAASGGDVDYRDVLDSIDTDGDGVLNNEDLDDDNDGITDTQELCGTDPSSTVIPSTILVSITTDNFPAETTWTLTGPSGVIATGGPYTGQPATTINTPVVTVLTGAFSFTISDSGSNGICCSFGNGSYNVLLNGASIANGGSFGASETTNFNVQTNINPFTCFSGDPNEDADSDGILNYQDSDFCTLNANGVCANMDTDGDGVINSLDLDSDNDGIFDIVESNALSVSGVNDSDNDGRIDGGTVPANVGANGVFNNLETSSESGILNYTFSESTDDTDSILDYLDLDSDGDGIPDNVEGQTTIGYVAPAGVVNSDGVDTSYPNGVTPTNTDGADNPDYLDTDSDNEGSDDTTEAGLTLANADADNDGLDDNIDTTSDYTDPAGTIDNPLTGVLQLPDIDSDASSGGDVDFRDDSIDNADLRLTKTVNNASPTVGLNVVFTLSVTNDGPLNATGVVVTDLIPSGYTYVSDTGSGSYTSGTGIWNVGTVNNGATSTLQITATVNGSGVYFNSAEITASDLNDPDSTPNNNISSEDDQDSVSTVPVIVGDSDADGILDTVDLDDDNDGITDTQELCGTDPLPTSNTVTITITIDLDRYEGETTWNLVDPSSNTIGSGGTYAGGDEIITQNFNVSESGTYTFTIFDSFGDGLNSSGGSDSNGSAGYSIDVDASNVFTSSNYPDFGFSSVHNFVVTVPPSNPFSCLASDPMGNDDADGLLNYEDPDYCTLNANGVCASLDSDGDGIINSLDLDSDNDGIHDILESGATTVSGVLDSDFDGRIDTASSANVGTNGVFDAVETTADSGVLGYTIVDSDSDTNYDFLELDADNDSCNDVIEAGFTDDNSDGLLGPASVVVDANGLVTSGSDGYTTPNDNNGNTVFDFQEAGTTPSITTQPVDQSICPSSNSTFTVVATNADTYQWQLFNGSTWDDLTDTGIHTGTTTTTLTITNAQVSDDGNQYRVLVSNSEFACGTITSNTATLTVSDTTLPVITGCPSNITTNVDSGTCGAIVTWTLPTATDNCGGVTLTSNNYNPGDSFLPGVTTVVYTATDDSGNTATCSFTVTVNDNEAPTINGPSNITVSADAGVCEAVVNYTLPTVSDNCAMGDGTYPVFEDFEVPSRNDLIDECWQFAGSTVSTNNPLSATTSMRTSNLISTESRTLISPLVYLNGTGQLTFLHRIDQARNSNRITVSLVDEADVATVIFNETYADNSVQTEAIDINLTGNYRVRFDFDTNSNATDRARLDDVSIPGLKVADTSGSGACPAATLQVVQTSGFTTGGTFPVGTTTNTFEVTDAFGNTNTYSFDITVTDDEAPTASNPAPIAVNCSAEVPVADPTVVTDEADNCTLTPTVTFISDVSDGGTNPEIITRTYRISDAGGNTTDVTQTITISPFEITSQPVNQTVFAGNNATFSVTANNVDTYQWQVSTNGGGSYSNISDGSEYSGTQTTTLTVNSPDVDKNGYLYRVLLSNSTSTCPDLTSSPATLTVRVGRVITNRRITFRVNIN
ncbi:HYR domain-containing protein [Flagellimonas allohymeniacidonis]|uniref:HYR domain-containing protein n=1 Tax=Flagellimonas allohymeniacidonis TaxID=2517819 RepID=A0A4Q8QC82_9FLAO|nr:HYR domain-containing protein [Allomuricauda hymeniacidonis]TAI46698.1 HYR domain-containing protein [Allomuricauda hymeniacidonis]